MTDEKSVPEQIRDTIEASDYPELTVREVTQRTGLTEEQVYSTAGSMDRLELDQRVGVVRLPEDDGGEFVDDLEHELVTDGGVEQDGWMLGQPVYRTGIAIFAVGAVVSAIGTESPLLITSGMAVYFIGMAFQIGEVSTRRWSA